ncbi:MAG: hypothetical protein JOZ44_13225, partial [Acidobacteria bacterium]|nr:hypothetical protein [Acidobacteriota bacterium]
MFGIRRRALIGYGIAAITVFCACHTFAETIPQNLYNGMRWRQVGPFRGGRAEAATGISGDPLTYYFGAV